MLHLARGGGRTAASSAPPLPAGGGNTIPKDDTLLIRVTEKDVQKKEVEKEEEQKFIFLDHDYESPSRWCWNQYNLEIVSYNAGYIVRSIMKKITCGICTESLTDKETSLLLQNRKCRGGLVTPSSDVICICKVAERVLRNTPNIFSMKNAIPTLILRVKNLLLQETFSNIEHMFDQLFLSDHRSHLVVAILTQYFKVRLYHEGTSRQDCIDRIRTFHNKLVLFANQ